MKIIEIVSLQNGAHDNQEICNVDSSAFQVPSGWAIIPDDMETPNFPFGEVTVDDTQTPPIVTKWTAGTIPEPEPAAEPEPTQLDRVEAQATYTAMMTDTLMEG